VEAFHREGDCRSVVQEAGIEPATTAGSFFFPGFRGRRSRLCSNRVAHLVVSGKLLASGGYL
jgi:hypothetical protein